MKKSLIILICALPLMLLAQEMPSPNQAGLIGLQNVPVNLYNGVASVSVPLYTVDGGGGQIPISLQYNTGGIRVAEEASTIGLGWNLNAGGSITRVMRGEADELSEWNSSIANSDIKQHIKLAKDGEKDLFYFSYPGGGGKFIFGDTFTTQCDSDYNLDISCAGANNYANCMRKGRRYEKDLDCKNAPVDSEDFITLPYQDIKIEFHYEDRDESYFTITDAMGAKYVFDELEITNSNSRKSNPSEAFEETGQREYISTWHLTEIYYPNLPDSRKVTFTYSTYNTTQYSYSHRQRYGYDLLQSQFVTSQGVKTYESKRSVGEKYIKTIKTGNQSTEVHFDYDTRLDRWDSRRLAKIRVENHQNITVQNIDFNHDYFDANNSYDQGGKLTTCVDDSNCKRLKLESIEINNLKVRSFDYTNGKSTNSTYAGADMYELPPKDAVYYDHRGYYNGDSDMRSVAPGDFTYSEIPYVASMCGEGSINGYCETMDGADRSYTTYVSACSLSKISYPTGAYTELTYGYNVQNGGARIDRMENFDENHKSVSGNAYDYINENMPLTPVYFERAPKDGQYYDIWSMSSVLSNDLNGLTAGYQQVNTTDIKTLAKTETYFNSLLDRDLEPAVKRVFTWTDPSGSNTTNLSVPTNSNSAPFLTDDLEYFDRGTSKEVKFFDATGIHKSTQATTYLKETNVIETVDNLHVKFKKINELDHFMGGSDYEEKYYVGTYKIMYRPVHMTGTTSTVDQDGVDITTTTDYEYHGTYKSIPYRVISTRPDGSRTESVTKFPYDKSPSSGTYKSMLDKHMIAIPVEKIIGIADPGELLFRTVAASVSEFTGSTVINPLRTHQLVINEPLPFSDYHQMTLTGSTINLDSRMESYSDATYDTNSYLINTTQKNGIQKSYDYDGYGYVTDSYSESTLETRSSQYEYEPLIGIKKVTDTNGDHISYEYDGRKRLYVTRDKDNNIVKRYRYHAINDEYGSSISVLGSPMVNHSSTFELSSAAALFGNQNTFDWNICGELITTTNEYASVTFTQTGTCTVSVEVSSPEYSEPILFSKQITVEDDTEFRICGASTYDVPSKTAYGCFSQTFTGTAVLEYSTINCPVTIDSQSLPHEIRWYYRIDSGSWIELSAFDNEYVAELTESQFGSTFSQIEVKCEVGSEVVTFKTNSGLV